jgi:DNA-binding transcriptional MerR regulator
MRIGELSRHSGVSVPTIKYYLREGLLSPGASSGPNQADYDERHLYRLRLIRTFVEVGGLSIAAVGQVLSALDDEAVEGHQLLGVAHRAIAPRSTASRDGTWQASRAEAAAFIATRGWHVSPDAPALDQLADVLAAVRNLGFDELRAAADTYADAAELVAGRDLATVATRGGSGDDDGEARALMMEAVVTGTVLGEAMLAALRRLAQEDASARLNPGTDPDCAP